MKVEKKNRRRMDQKSSKSYWKIKIKKSTKSDDSEKWKKQKSKVRKTSNSKEYKKK